MHHLFLGASDYTHVYEKCGLLTPKTMLGHCIHLNAARDRSDRRRPIQCGPLSDLESVSWAAVLIKLDQMMRAGIAVGLGSDVAAGPELNMWQVMRAAIDGAKGAGACTNQTCRRCFRGRHFIWRPREARPRSGKGDHHRQSGAGKGGGFAGGGFERSSSLSRGTGIACDQLSTEDVIALCIYRGGPHGDGRDLCSGQTGLSKSRPAGAT